MKIIKFYKEGCSPCEAVSNYLDSKNVQYESIIPFKDPKFAVKLGIKSVPTVVVVNDNEEVVFRSVGFNPEELQNLVEQYT